MALEKSLDRGKTIETKAEEEKKKSYLRQLCERLNLDPAKDYSKEETDQQEPSDRKRKFLVEKIDYYERSKKQKSTELFNARGMEIITVNTTREDKFYLSNLSLRIHSIEWTIAGDLKSIGILRLTNNEAAKNFLYPIIEFNLKKKVAMRQKLINEYQSMLQNNR